MIIIYNVLQSLYYFSGGVSFVPEVSAVPSPPTLPPYVTTKIKWQQNFYLMLMLDMFCDSCFRIEATIFQFALSVKLEKK